MINDMNLTSKLMVILLVLIKIVVEIRAAPVSLESVALDLCPPPGICYWDPEETCKSHSDCRLSSNRRIDLCCPHACKGKKVCRDFLLPEPSTTTRSTTEDITTPEFKTQLPTKLSTTEMPTSTPKSMNSITTDADLLTGAIDSTNKPTIVIRSTSTEESVSTAKPSATKSQLTPKARPEVTTTELPATELPTETTTEFVTTKSSTTIQTPTTTKIPNTPKQPTTTLSPSTVPTTQSTTRDPSICGRSNAKDILFIIDGTVNYRQFWVTRAKEFKQVKYFIKDVISELKGDKFNVGVMQYGGRIEPEMEIDFWEDATNDFLVNKIDDIKQMGGEKRFTGATLAVANNKFYELNSLYERASAQDIIVLITRGRPSDKKQLSAEVDMLRRRKIRIIAIGMSSFPRYLARTLKRIASSNEDVLLSKYSDLANKKTDLLEKICLPAKLPGIEALCRNKKYDIHILIDGSRSINYLQFDKKRKFLRDVLFLLEAQPSDLNIGMIQFSTVEKTEEILELEKHSFAEELNIIENMEYHSGKRTMLGDALNRVNDKVFNGSGGDRSTVENVLVIFSDGEAHDIYDAYREADNMKERNVRVIGISANEHGYIPDALKKLATDPKYTLSIKLSNTAYFARKAVSMICQVGE